MMCKYKSLLKCKIKLLTYRFYVTGNEPFYLFVYLCITLLAVERICVSNNSDPLVILMICLCMVILLKVFVRITAYSELREKGDTNNVLQTSTKGLSIGQLTYCLSLSCFPSSSRFLSLVFFAILMGTCSNAVKR